MNKQLLKEQFIKLFLEGKNYSEISKLTGWSRKFITDLIKDDTRIIMQKNSKKIKVCKRKNNNQMIIYIPTQYIENIGISKNKQDSEYVDIFFNKDDETIIIKKHSN